MTTHVWLAIAAVTVATWVMKGAGPLVVGSRRLPAAVADVVPLAAPALLAGLLVVELGEDWSPASWPALAGVGVAGLVHLLRAPMLLAVAAAVVTTALLRLAFT